MSTKFVTIITKLAKLFILTRLIENNPLNICKKMRDLSLIALKIDTIFYYIANSSLLNRYLDRGLFNNCQFLSIEITRDHFYNIQPAALARCIPD